MGCNNKGDEGDCLKHPRRRVWTQSEDQVNSEGQYPKSFPAFHLIPPASPLHFIPVSSTLPTSQLLRDAPGIQDTSSRKLFRNLRYSYPRSHLAIRRHHPPERNSRAGVLSSPTAPNPEARARHHRWLSPSGIMEVPSRHLGF